MSNWPTYSGHNKNNVYMFVCHQWAGGESVYPELGGAPRVPSQIGSQDTNQTTRGVRKNFSPLDLPNADAHFLMRRSGFFQRKGSLKKRDNHLFDLSVFSSFSSSSSFRHGDNYYYSLRTCLGDNENCEIA
jgi:hypothetical protein